MLSEIISKLKDIQARKGFIDEEMADQLGCSRQLYQGTRSGKIPLGNKILKGILTAFPELKQDVIYFLSNDANRLPCNASKNPLTQTLEAQGRGLKRFCVGLIGGIKRIMWWLGKAY